MANEIGYYNAGNGGQTQNNFSTSAYGNVAGAATYVANAGDTITHVRFHRTSSGSAGDITVGLYACSSSTAINTGAGVLASVVVTTTGTTAEFGADVSWALTGGVRYALALCMTTGNFTITGDTLTNGCDTNDSGNGLSGNWVHSQYKGINMELAGDVLAGATRNMIPLLNYYRRLILPNG